MKIGIDLDNVIFDVQSVEKKIHVLMGEAWKPSADWGFTKVKPRVREAIFKAFDNPTIMVDRMQYKHSRATLHKCFNDLRFEGHELYIISSRSEKVAGQTIQKIREDFGNYFPKENIHVAPCKSKIGTIQNFKLDLMIDDSPHVIKDCIDHGIDCIMISAESYLYNHHMRDKAKWTGSFLSACNKILKESI